MPLKTGSIEEPHLNLTPMIDIVFLLIIFFMVGTRFTELERQYDVQLPTVSEAQPLTGLPDEITVNVRQDGTVVVRGEERTLGELEAELRAARARYADQAVLVRADGTGPYQHVMDVLSVCQRVNIASVSLAHRVQAGDER